MKVAFVTNIRAPYRILQFNEFAKINDIKFTAYYTHKESENRKWESKKNIGYDEIYLGGFNLSEKYGYINKGIFNLVNNNDVIIIGGYEQPTYIFISILCKLLKKKYIISFDGISTNRLSDCESKLKKTIKNIVIKNASFILGNGEVSKIYFNEVFNYPIKKIYNQYLTVDGELINTLYKEKEKNRVEFRNKYGIKFNEKVLMYTGRLIDIKNLDSIIRAISTLKKLDITLVVVGGGDLEDRLNQLAAELNIKIIITGFISNQEELFKHYFLADAFILSSLYEPWGLVVNEAMFAGLPVIVSSICGCSLDLVKNNGYIINPYDLDDIKNKINRLLYEDDIDYMGRKSREIINEWTFENSRINLEKILEN
ncbi:MAG: glycosyltransferase family 4 protein [Clostridium sp.]|uniref:glycosyltransferase family 4 protein n=1 Tax=Clostridium sp. TaxID=1506 RepID=UPI0029133C2B|nr:glycosyltransferase family 4 protein [Clostridium sp.]MDU6365065.1 glycosyltransferase family 4 protein [Clostridium sp.]